MPEEVIELSLEESNKLRAKLGLAPLRTGDGKQETVLEMGVDETNKLREKLGLKPLNTSKKEIVHAPAENLTVKKEAKERIEKAKLQKQVERGIGKFEATSLADEGNDTKTWAKAMRKMKKKAAKQAKKSKEVTKEYDESELTGIHVAHSASDIEHGKDVVLTLADNSILEEDEGPALENVNLTDKQRQEKGLQEKRKLEMGAGRAGGYAGFDDDEFEELGGTQGPSRLARGFQGPTEDKKKSKGFQIGKKLAEEDEMDEATELEAMKKGNKISLLSSKPDTIASDFMTAEEAEQLKKSKKKKEAKFKKQKKQSKKSRKTTESDDEDDAPLGLIRRSNNLLEELESTADTKIQLKKRKKQDSDAGEDAMDVDEDETRRAQEKKQKFKEVMAKGTQRVIEAFSAKPKPAVDLDEEPDDDFLNAALAKARRLNRLKKMSGDNKPKGAEAIIEAVRSAPIEEAKSGGNTVSFSVDDTREFTRALRAKAEQSERLNARKAVKKESDVPNLVESKKSATTQVAVETVEDNEDVNMVELAKEIKEEPVEQDDNLQPSLGRGLGGILGMLRQTGALNTGGPKEELRGRAKDERNYDNYEDLDLNDVVKIDERNATDKDKEFAKRQIKLEYRDKYGRLLTTKEAFRDLSHQFHGHTGGKRKEEKMKQQIAREQAESRIASEAAAGGTFGALKKAQQATGKAYVVHKA